MSIKFKEGVSVDGITKECIQGMGKANWALGKMFRHCIITSVTDGIHGVGSKHYSGNAFDIRTWTTETSGKQLPNKDKERIASRLRFYLGEDWDVVVEATHIHCEYDPK